jgi:hypothetical protein
LRGEAEEFCASGDATLGLRHAALDVVGRSIRHRLNTNRVFATYLNIAHLGGGGLSAVVSQLNVHKSPNLVQSYANILVLAIKNTNFCIFLSKYLVMSKKSSTFAPAFEWKRVFCATIE